MKLLKKIVFKLYTKIVFKLFKIFVPESIKRELLIFSYRLHHINESYSQEGEDLLLNRIFNKSNGFFIDIGAHHPKRYSNTYKLYLIGWTGINIEPASGTKALFDKLRPKDINLEIGINETEGHLIYYAFNDPAFNTFSPQEAQNFSALKDVYIISETKLKTYPLFKVLDMYLPDNLPIDFMTIDVEGLDLAVLKSNDWTKYRPDYILVEELRMDINSIINTSEVYKYLTTKGYTFYARTFNTSFYKKNVEV